MPNAERLSDVNPALAGNGTIPLPDELDTKDREEAKRLAETLSPLEPVGITRFGADIQEEIADFASAVLDQVRSRDAGDVGETMTELIMRIRSMPASAAEQERRHKLHVSIPAVNRLLARVKRAVAKTQTLEEQVETVRTRLEEAYFTLQQDIELLEQVLVRNHTYFRKLDVRIAAVELRLKQAEDKELPALRRKVDEGRDPWAAQQLGDMNAFMKRLETRLDDFRRTRFLSLAQAPKIRLLQQAAQMMMERIQAVLYNLIPVWKLDLVAGVAEQRASRAHALHRKVRESIEEGLTESAERTRLLTVSMTAAGENGLIGTPALRNVHESLIGALEDTIRIYAEGRRNRLEAERELNGMERELKLKIAELADRTV